MERYLLKYEKLSFLENRYLQLSLLYGLSFSIPFLLRGPQLLVGSLLNFLFILAISRYKFKEILPALLLPSVAVYSYGVLFGGATSFLLYLIPVITFGNIIFVISFQKIKSKYLNIIFAAILKSFFLFSLTYILFKTIGLPQIFLTTMGITQLITAIIGGLMGTIVTDQKDI
jgi:hypothetical protein